MRPLALDLDLAVACTNGDAVGVPDNQRVLPIAMCLPSGFLVFPGMLFRLEESIKRPVEPSTIYLLLIPKVEMRLTALLTLLVQVGIGSLFCLQVTQLMCLDTVEPNRTPQCLWLDKMHTKMRARTTEGRNKRTT